MTDLRHRLRINEQNLQKINDFLLDEANPLVSQLLELIEKYGGVDEINKKAEEASHIDSLMALLRKVDSPYIEALEWLIKKRDSNAFISIPEYRRKILGQKVNSFTFTDSFAITLEISACNYFEWMIEEAKRAIEHQDLMPGRFIRVRSMKEQVEDDEVVAFAAAMKIIGASFVGNP